MSTTVSQTHFCDWAPEQRIGRSITHRKSQPLTDAWRTVPVEVRTPTGIFTLEVTRWTNAQQVADEMAHTRGLSAKHAGRLAEAIELVQRDHLVL